MCWYDLQGASSLPARCSECGSLTLTREALLATRRRVSGIVIGALLIIAGLGSAAHQDLRITNNTSGPWSMSNRQLRAWLDAQVKGDPAGWAGLVQTRALWPADEPAYVTLHPPRWLEDAMGIGHIRVVGADGVAFTKHSGHFFVGCLGPTDGEEAANGVVLLANGASPRSVMVELARGPETAPAIVWRRAAPVTTTIDGPVLDHTSPVESPDLERWFTQDAIVKFRWSPVGGEGPRAYIDFFNPASALSLVDGRTLALHFDVVHDGVIIATGSHWWSTRRRQRWQYVQGRWPTDVDRVYLRLTGAAPPCIDPDTPGRWTLRIRPAPELALREYDANSHWSIFAEAPLAGVSITTETADGRETLRWEDRDRLKRAGVYFHPEPASPAEPK